MEVSTNNYGGNLSTPLMISWPQQAESGQSPPGEAEPIPNPYIYEYYLLVLQRDRHQYGATLLSSDVVSTCSGRQRQLNSIVGNVC